MSSVSYGDAVFTVLYDNEGNRTIRCDHADPRIRVSPVLVQRWHTGDLAATWPGAPDPVSVRCAGTCPIGDVITIDCVNRRLVYRITGSEPVWLEGDEPLTYLAEWPD